ncbi:MAG: UDP-glucose 4-epimerase GalE [Planctomycetaceae bacterium]|jgi:UDP-glucose 4-epimerase|nr:UDP-glucose 4-epimerase GalE [Planctomycetaceae bacterium]
MNILVTGGAGYIGSHAVRQLVKAGHNVVILDNLSYGHKQSLPDGVPFYQTDIAETNKVEEILRTHRIEAVMHFAAFISVGESVEKPLRYYRNNTAGAMSLLEAMERAGVKRFVFSSTAATYGEPAEVPIYETTPQNPINPYGRSKWFVEQILKDIAAADPDFRFIAFRYFNVAGASADASIGEDHQPETHLIPLVLFAAMGKRPNIKVFGTDYPTEDGTCIRDYVHVDDLIAAHILAVETLGNAPQAAAANTFYNLGIGRGYSVKEILDASEKVVGGKIPTVHGERRPGDPAKLYANSDKVQKELGWKPQHTDTEEVIATAWKWHTTHPNGYSGSSF